ncbi:MAG: monofunctional biosynthetic peptidoglycan transglycosylase [Rhizobiaceae bacterium]
MRFVFLVAALAFLPVLLTVLYALPFVHPVSTLMLKDTVMMNDYERRWVELEDIAPVLVHSVTMSEDGQFCSHHGIDLGALNEVIGDALDGEPVRGASTIPMQTVKNLYLWQDRSYLRKALEAPMALMLDLILSKKRIMEIYLNIVEWGPGVYGAEAAARHHFGRPASKLTSRQAALLAVTLPNPIARNPARPTRKLNQLASIIQKRVRQASSHIACFK